MERPPTEREKLEVEFFEKMMNKGYKLKLLRGRKGSYIDWIKEN